MQVRVGGRGLVGGHFTAVVLQFPEFSQTGAGGWKQSVGTVCLFPLGDSTVWRQSEHLECQLETCIV